MLSKIFLAAFNDNLQEADLERIYMVHKNLHLTQDDLDEWMKCFVGSLDEIGVKGDMKNVLIAKVSVIGNCLVGEKHGDLSLMLELLIEDVGDEICCGRDATIERLKKIKEQM